MSDSYNDGVTGKMPIESNDGARATPDELGNNGNDDEERQRSLLQTLWNEATSTTDLPSKDTRLHLRRAKSAEGAGNIESTSPGQTNDIMAGDVDCGK